MKTAEERAREFCDTLPLAWTNFRADVEVAVYLLIKEQDRVTRAACAEAVMAVCYTRDNLGNCDILRSQAEAACMNVKAC